MSSNPELDLARRYVRETDRHIFLTGKAGTGKTTFLHGIRDTVPKRKVVVAPTGVAAINAAGVTIHSQFQLPFGVLHPERLQAELRTHRLSRQKAEVLQGLDLLVIDEISMVRADVLDAISAVLSKYRRDDRPFGGVQLLMIGDLHQLPPVVRDHEWGEMSGSYTTPYFFGSRALARAGVITIQLKHIYRQSDAEFIDLLNRVRHDRMDEATLAQLNTRYRGPEFEADEREEYITLTSHNRTANGINEKQLETLSTQLHHFEAVIEGEFPSSMYPNDPKQKFRVGAQVMYNKNDTAGRTYYNGKIGRITAIEGDTITVVSPGEAPIEVVPVAWENRKYSLDKKTKEVSDTVIGTFAQHPLRLAWAITIHKSQGLTFDRVIIDAAAAFAHGQVYVALSRCKTFEGIVLRSRIGNGSVRTDRVVSDYSSRAEREAPTPEDLRADRHRYHYNCLHELFDFTETDRTLARLERALFEHEAAIQGEALREIRSLRETVEGKLGQVSRSFLLQLRSYRESPELPAEHAELGDRLKKASAYMLPHIRDAYAALAASSFMSDNQKVYDQVTERMRECGRALFVKLRGFESLTEGFSADRYLRAKADALMDFSQKKERTTGRAAPAEGTTDHPALYAQLAAWRTARAADGGVPPYRILHNAVLLALCARLPGNRDDLLGVPGFGKRSYEEYGEELLSLVRDYVEANPLEVNAGERPGTDPIPLPGAVSSTREITLAAFRKGKSVEEIAALRGLTPGTISGHLLYWIREGRLAAEEVLSEATFTALTEYLATYEGEGLRPVYEHFAEAYTYEEIRMAAASLAM